MSDIRMSAVLEAQYRGADSFHEMERDIVSAEEHLKRLGKASANPRVGLKTAEFNADLAKAERRLDEFGKKRVKVEARMDLDTKAADQKLDAFSRRRAVVNATVDLDTEKAIGRINAIKSKRVVVPAEINLDSTAANRKVDALKAKHVTVNGSVDLDDAAAKRQIGVLKAEHPVVKAVVDLDSIDAERRVEALKAKTINIPASVDLDVSAADGKLRAFASKRPTIKATVDLDTGSAEGKLRAFAASNAKLTIRADLDLGAARAQLASFSSGSGKVTIQVDVDLAMAATKIETFIRFYSGQTITLNVDVDTGAAAAQIAALIAALEALRGGAGGASGAVSGLGSSLSGGAAGMALMAAAASAVVVVLAPLAAGAVIAGTAVAALAAGAALVAAPLVALVQGATQGADATKKQADAAKQGEAASGAYASALEQQADSQRAVGDAVRQANEGTAQAVQQYKQALQGVGDQERSLTDARRQAAEGSAAAVQQYQQSLQGVSDQERALTDARRQAAEGVAAAQQQYKQSLQGVADQERAVADARRQAAEGVAAAQQQYKQSLQGVADQERALADARRQAAEGVAAAQQQYRQSLQGVADQERALADARKQAAEQSAQAVRQYKDSLNAVADQERALADARRQAAEQSRTAVEQYKQSVQATADAERNLKDQRAALQLSTRDLSTAQYELNRAMQAEPDRVIRTELDLQQARLNQKQTALDVSSAERDLQKARATGTPLEVQQGELRLQQLRLSQQRGAIDTRDAERQLADVRKRGTSELRGAVTSEEAARRQQQQGIRGVSDAERQLAKNRADQGRAFQNISKVQTEGNRTVADSQKALRKAVEQQGLAAQNVAKTQRDGARQVADAQKALGRAVEQQGLAYAGFVKAQRDGARQIQDAERQATKARQQSAEAFRGIAKAQAEGQRRIADSERQLQRSREEAARSFQGIAKTQIEGQRRIADAERQLQRSREQAGKAYQGIAKAQQEGARRIQDSERQLQRSREESNRAFQGIAKAQAEGQRRIEDAQRGVARASQAVDKAARQMAEGQGSAAKAGHEVWEALKRQIPALAQIGPAFRRAFGPGSPSSAAVMGLANDVVMIGVRAMPALGRASEQTATAVGQAFRTLRDRDLGQFEKNSLQRFLDSVPRISADATLAVGRFGGGVANILGIAAPYAERLTSAVAAAADKFLKWSESQSGRDQIERFLKSAAPVAESLGRLLFTVGAALVDIGIKHGPDAAKIIDQVASFVKPLAGLIGGTVRATADFGEALNGTRDYSDRTKESVGRMRGELGDIAVDLGVLSANQLPGFKKALDENRGGAFLLGESFVDAGERARKGLGDNLDGVIEDLSSLPGDMYNLGVDMLKGLLNALKDGAGVVKDSLSNLVGNAFDAAKKKLGIESPSKEMGWLADMTVLGYVDRVKAGVARVREAASSLVGAAVAGAHRAAEGFRSVPVAAAQATRPSTTGTGGTQGGQSASLRAAESNPTKALADNTRRDGLRIVTDAKKAGRDASKALIDGLTDARVRGGKEFASLVRDVARSAQGLGRSVGDNARRMSQGLTRETGEMRVKGGRDIAGLVRQGIQDATRMHRGVLKETSDLSRNSVREFGRMRQGGTKETEALNRGATRSLADLSTRGGKEADELRKGGLRSLTDLNRSGTKQADELKLQGIKRFTDLQQGGTRQVDDLRKSGVAHLMDLNRSGTKQAEDLKVQGIKRLTDFQQGGTKQAEDLKVNGIKRLTDFQKEGTSQTDELKANGIKRLTDFQKEGTAQSDSLRTNGVERLTALQKEGTGQTETLKANGIERLTTLQKEGTNQSEALKANGIQRFTDLQKGGTDQTDLLKVNGVQRLDDLNKDGTSKMENLRAAGLDKLTLFKEHGTQQTEDLKKNAIDRMTIMNKDSVGQVENLRRDGLQRIDDFKGKGSETMTKLGQEWPKGPEEAKAKTIDHMNGMLDGMNKFIDETGVDVKKANLIGSLGAPQGGTDASGPQNALAGIRGMAEGGILDSNSVLMMASGGVVTEGLGEIIRDAIWQGPTGGISDGLAPRVVFGEKGRSGTRAKEAYIREDMPTHTQVPYIVEAARWHGLKVGSESSKPHAHLPSDAAERVFRGQREVGLKHMAEGGLFMGVPGGYILYDYQQYIPGYPYSTDSRHKGVDVWSSQGGPHPVYNTNYRARIQDFADWSEGTTGIAHDANTKDGQVRGLVAGHTAPSVSIGQDVAPNSLLGHAQQFVEPGNFHTHWQAYSQSVMSTNPLYTQVEPPLMDPKIALKEVSGGIGVPSQGSPGSGPDYNAMLEKAIPKTPDMPQHIVGDTAGKMLDKLRSSLIEEVMKKVPQSGGDVTGGPKSDAQRDVAKWMAAEAVKRKIPDVLPVMTSLTESELTNVNYGDRDSLGYFQQRPSAGWGTPEQIMDPKYSLGKFLDAAAAVQRAVSWTDAAGLGSWAQDVQGSAFPERYAQRYGEARSLVGAPPKGYTDGGIALKDQVARIAENGPELFVPLNDPASTRRFMDFVEKAAKEKGMRGFGDEDTKHQTRLLEETLRHTRRTADATERSHRAGRFGRPGPVAGAATAASSPVVTGITGIGLLPDPSHEEHGLDRGVRYADVSLGWDNVNDNAIRYRMNSAYAADITAAIEAWNAVSAVKMVPAGSGAVDLNIFDRTLEDGILARTWEDGNMAYNPSYMNVATPNARRAGAAHEIGHSHGMGHVYDVASVLNTPVWIDRTNNNERPTPYDISEDRRIWGDAKPATAPPRPTATAPPTTTTPTTRPPVTPTTTPGTPPSATNPGGSIYQINKHTTTYSQHNTQRGHGPQSSDYHQVSGGRNTLQSGDSNFVLDLLKRIGLSGRIPLGAFAQGGVALKPQIAEVALNGPEFFAPLDSPVVDRLLDTVEDSRPHRSPRDSEMRELKEEVRKLRRVQEKAHERNEGGMDRQTDALIAALKEIGLSDEAAEKVGRTVKEGVDRNLEHSPITREAARKGQKKLGRFARSGGPSSEGW